MHNAEKTPGEDLRNDAPVWEVWLVAALLGLFCLALFPTIAHFSLPVLDESSYADPAANLYFGDGFVSRAWYLQDGDEFWAGNTPLYPFVLAQWFRVFGFSLTSARMFSVVTYALACGIIWWTVRQRAWVNMPWQRILLVLVLLIAHGPFNTWRNARPDTLCLLIAAMMFAVGFLTTGVVRAGAIAVLASLLPAAGLQLVVAVGFAFAVLLILWPRSIGVGICALLGVIVGGLFLYWLYRSHGVWEVFDQSTRGTHTGGNQRAWSGFKDPGTGLIAILGLLSVGILMSKGRFQWRSPAGAGMIIGLAMPWVLVGLSKYHAYYVTLAFLPLAVGSFAAYSKAALAIPRPIFGGLILLACLTGTPLRLIAIAETWPARDEAPVRDLVARNVRSNDVAWCYESAYFATRPRAGVTYSTWCLPPEGRRSIVTVAIVADFDKETLLKLGGVWKQVDEWPAPNLQLSRVGRFVFSLTSDRILGLKVYRRVE